MGAQGKEGRRPWLASWAVSLRTAQPCVSHSSGLWEGSQPRKRGTRRKGTGHMAGTMQSVLSALD